MRTTGSPETGMIGNRLYNIYNNYVYAVPKEIKAMLEKLRTQIVTSGSGTA
jgi:hypothetical protein